MATYVCEQATYRYLTKMYWACFMTEHCNLTMQLYNTSDQRRKRSIALRESLLAQTLNYYVLARRSSTNHSTQRSALTQKYWQNTSYQLGGMNNWLYAVMTISAHWFNICSHIWEGKGAVLLPAYAPSNSDRSPCGRGGDADRVNISYGPYLNFCHPR